MEEEKLIKNYPDPVTIEGTEKILDQMKSSICKIFKGNGTGFFCLISYKNESLRTLINN